MPALEASQAALRLPHGISCRMETIRLFTVWFKSFVQKSGLQKRSCEDLGTAQQNIQRALDPLKLSLPDLLMQFGDTALSLTLDLLLLSS